MAGRRRGPDSRHGRRPIFAGEGDIDAAREIVEKVGDAELFLYSGDQHYFADNSLLSYDADATALFTTRVLRFPASITPAFIYAMGSEFTTGETGGSQDRLGDEVFSPG